MLDQTAFDPRQIERFVSDKLPDIEGPMSIARISGGQSNPTFLLMFANRKLVLRKKPPGKLLPSAHAIDREFRVQQALRDSGVPVPQMLLFHDGPEVVGTAFYIMEFVDGRIFHDCSLGDAPIEERTAMYESAAHILARLHQVSPKDIGLSDFGRQGGYFARQIARWSRQLEMSKVEKNPELEKLRSWLETNVPPDSEQASVIHGDYRLGNMIFHPTEPRVVAVLDWELATLGDGLADLAHFCTFTWWMKRAEYGGLLDTEYEKEALPTPDAFISMYSDGGGVGRLSPFHIVFALFRNAIIFEGIAARARSGNAAARNAETVGKLSGVLAHRAVEFLERS